MREEGEAEVEDDGDEEEEEEVWRDSLSGGDGKRKQDIDLEVTFSRFVLLSSSLHFYL